jgi:CMP-N-acetylneuraminic acid synthetase
MPALIVIPARGGSKGIPRKNVKLLAGRPLLSYAVSAALAARCRATVVVTTDDDEIADCAQTCGAQVLRRSAALSDDAVPLDPVVLDAAERMRGDYDAVITVQPTSPFVTAADIDAAYALLMRTSANVVFTATDDTHLTWSVEGDAVVPQYAARVNRQLLPRRLRETGAVVCTRRTTLLAEKVRFVAPYAVIEVDAARAIDIDTPTDWLFAEAAFSVLTETAS